jgi:CheY-like chemotaxis protein
LIVEDDEFNILTLDLVLRNLGILADQAGNGLVAFEMVKNSFKCCPYRLVFMDINMPVMDGLEAS